MLSRRDSLNSNASDNMHPASNYVPPGGSPVLRVFGNVEMSEAILLEVDRDSTGFFTILRCQQVCVFFRNVIKGSPRLQRLLRHEICSPQPNQQITDCICPVLGAGVLPNDRRVIIRLDAIRVFEITVRVKDDGFTVITEMKVDPVNGREWRNLSPSYLVLLALPSWTYMNLFSRRNVCDLASNNAWIVNSRRENVTIHDLYLQIAWRGQALSKALVRLTYDVSLL